MLKSGLSSLLSGDGDHDELDIEELIGPSADSKWTVCTLGSNKTQTSSQEGGSEGPDNIYQYEGTWRIFM